MDAEAYVRWRTKPELRAPLLLAAFAGWNDASQVATFSLATLLKVWSATRVAEIDPEEFFDFTDTRPTISLDATRQRSLHWPTNAFFAHQLGESGHDVVLLIGTEPQLKWRTFTQSVVHVAQLLDVTCLVTLGGLMADVPHTREPRLTGFTSSPELLPRLEKMGVEPSGYEGPTGIIGALHDAWQRTERPSISLWGNVPHYISAAPNPQIALALLERLGSLLGVALPLEPLQSEAATFRSRIDEALAENPEALDYVQQLERHFSEAPPEAAGGELIEELEEFLRRRRPRNDGGAE
jgi:proteasome assembly chaperone (PAC2) family protein